jgi:hypothetical protein
MRRSRFFPENCQALVALCEEQVLLSPGGQSEFVSVEFRQLTAAATATPPVCVPAKDCLDSLGEKSVSLLGWCLAGRTFPAPAHVLGGSEPQVVARPNDCIGWGIALTYDCPDLVKEHGNFPENGVTIQVRFPIRRTSTAADNLCHERYNGSHAFGSAMKYHRAESCLAFPETSSICSSPFVKIVLLSLASRSTAFRSTIRMRLLSKVRK